GRHIQIEDLSEARVGEYETFDAIDHRDAFHHGAENRGGKIALLRESADSAIEPLGRLIQGDAERFQSVALAVSRQRPKISFRYAQRELAQPLNAVGVR